MGPVIAGLRKDAFPSGRHTREFAREPDIRTLRDSFDGARDRPGSFLDYVKDDRVERQRYLTLREVLSSFAGLFAGRRVLDFGASHALSTCALLELGARQVLGLETDEARVLRARQILRDLGYDDRAAVEHVPDTTRLALADASVEVVVANAVLEHIPQPRVPYVRELWRVVGPGGYLIINETPNKYLPVDFHTTGLWFVPWLPSAMARRYAVWRGRFSARADWARSGWRGVGFYEVLAGLTAPYGYLPEQSRWRHRLLTRLGLPASLIDPYPTLIFKKLAFPILPSTREIVLKSWGK
jgi:SAM-dependent methyltransferase